MYVYPDTECRLLTPQPRTAREANALRKQPDVQRIAIVSHLGAAPYVRCWCGSRLILDYSREAGGDEAMTTRLTTFLILHETCPPPAEEEVSHA